MFLSYKRIFNAGKNNFTRQIGLNIATTFVLAITLISLTAIFYIDGVNKYVFSLLQQKIGITVYFNIETPSEEIVRMKEEISRIKGVEGVSYTSKEEAYQKFSEKYYNDQTISSALEIAGEDVLPATLHIRAAKLENYEEVMNFLSNSEQYQDIISDVSYPRTEEVMKKVFSLADDIKKIGLGFSAFLGLVVILIVLNTVRLALHSNKDEVAVMRLMGASNWFVRGPYIVQGIICGFIAGIFSFLFYLIFSFFAGATFYSLSGGFDLFAFFKANLWIIILIQFFGGMLIGGLANALAVRRYMKI